MTALLIVENVNPYWLCLIRMTTVDNTNGIKITRPHVFKSRMFLNKIRGTKIKHTRYHDFDNVYLNEINGVVEVAEVKMIQKK